MTKRVPECPYRAEHRLQSSTGATDAMGSLTSRELRYRYSVSRWGPLIKAMGHSPRNTVDARVLCCFMGPVHSVEMSNLHAEIDHAHDAHIVQQRCEPGKLPEVEYMYVEALYLRRMLLTWD